MSDARLREREREAGLDPSARVRWLTERLRAGTLTRERVELAAYCGDDAAQAALGVVVVDNAAALGIVVDFGWARGLPRWGDEVVVRAALSAALLANHGYSRLTRRMVSWLRCPCSTHRQRWIREGRQVELDFLPVSPEDALTGRSIASAAQFAGEAEVRGTISRDLIAWALA